MAAKGQLIARGAPECSVGVRPEVAEAVCASGIQSELASGRRPPGGHEAAIIEQRVFELQLKGGVAPVLREREDAREVMRDATEIRDHVE